MHTPHLPVHLMALILQKLGTDNNYREAAHMRLVSRDWRAAFAETPGCASRMIQKEADIPKLAALVPSMSQVIMSIEGESVSLETLKAQAQLRSVLVFGYSSSITKECTTIDLRGLPDKLEQLSFVNDVQLLSASFSSLAGLSIKKLELEVIRNSSVDINRLLEYAPRLEVRNLETHLINHPLLSNFEMLSRLSAVSSFFIVPILQELLIAREEMNSEEIIIGRSGSA